MPKPKTKAVVVRQSAEVVPIRDMSDSAAVMQMIDRAARDPAVNIDKLERLQQMFERIKASSAKAEYMAALSAMQPELPMIEEGGIIKNKAGGIQSRYALWEAVVEAITPVLSRHGFALTFRNSNAEKLVTVTAVLSHRAGHSEETPIQLPVDTSDYRSAVQSIGSSVSYGKRYTAFALLNLRSTFSEDDDGQSGGVHEPRLDDNQVANIQAMLDESSNPAEAKRRFLKWAKVELIGDIPVKNYEAVCREIRARLIVR
jgi:ERF superfamily